VKSRTLRNLPCGGISRRKFKFVFGDDMSNTDATN
jgi:hypothetical protein